jgi:NADH-quinone oxidoreductase subunit J
MAIFDHPAQLILGIVLILSSLGVILAKKPVHSSLFFLLTLMTLAALYLQLSAQFIAVMQVLVYAGAILVLFIFVMILFQDAIQEIEDVKSKSLSLLLYLGGGTFILSLIYLGRQLFGMPSNNNGLNPALQFGSVETLGKALYIDFFFPFEAVILMFLVAIVGALYTARRG